MKPLIIGITGGSGSGKTTFIRQVKASFKKSEICIISQDDYYFPREAQKKDKKGIINFDLPSSIDKKSFNRDLKKLIKGESLSRKEYVFNNPKAAAKIITLAPAPIIIVEGLFVFHFKKIFKKLDLKVYLHAKDNLKVIRRIKRDRVERNYPIEDVLYRYEYHVMPAFEQYIQPYIQHADLVVHNNNAFEKGLQVLNGFLKDYLYSIRTNKEDYQFFEEE
ncbi:MAG: uridine kinase [Saprospiraceae bacterium]